MPVSEKQKKYSEKYIKNTFDELKVRIPKGNKETLQSHAKTKGESLNSFVNRAINEAIERDNSR